MAEPLFVRMKDLPAIVGISRAEIYKQIAEGRFPPPVKLGPKASAWTPDSLQAWRNKLVSEHTP